MAAVNPSLWGIHSMDDFLFLNQNLIALGWEEMEDLSSLPQSRDAFKERYMAVFPNAKKGAVANSAGMLYRFVWEMKEGDYILDFVGPLGTATDFGDAKKVCVIGGGVGNAIAYPSAKALFKAGVDVDVIAGFRSKDIVILEDEYKSICNRLFITTDDGTYGEKGFVTNKLQDLIDAGNNYDLVIAIGPIPMMKFVSKVTEPYNIKTLVSLNPIMIDGTGMCGGCRVTVGGEIKFACVDGPDFDGHQVDYDELMKRNSTYREFEAHDRENCRMYKAADEMGGAK